MPPANIPTPRPPTQINARAAELKAKLLQRREGRASSATPPIHPGLASATTQPTRVDGSSSLRASPKTPTTAVEKHEQELNLNELISQYSESKPAAAASVKQENNNPDTSSIQRTPVHIGANSQAPSLGSPTNVTKPVTFRGNTGDLRKQPDKANGKSMGDKQTSNGSVSEGEIFEEKYPKSRESATVIRAKQNETQGNIPKSDEPITRRPRDDRTVKPYTRQLRDDSPPRRPPPINPKPQVQRNRDDRHEELDMRSVKRSYESYQPDYKNERKQHSDSERPAYQRRDNHEEDQRKPEFSEQRREEVSNRPVREQKPPILQDLLPLDEDLREWLDITGYHNIPYRSKILNRRRAIAALDAKRDQLLAEMAEEERGGLSAIAGGQVPASSMLPPPIPGKASGRAEPVATPSGDKSPDPQRDRVLSNKRPYSDVGDLRSEVNGAKLARTDDRGYQPQRSKEEDGSEYRRPRSGGFDASRRSPPIEHRDREMSRPRFEPRDRSRDRDSSPSSGRRAIEGRPAARGRGYDSDSFFDRDELPERGRGGYEVRGNYKGRAFDPDYRSRGRGRGRGDSRDFYQNEPRMETGFGSKIANGRPYKDHKGFDRGGRRGL